MSKLISEGGYGCVYHPGFDAKQPKTTDEETVVKLQRKSRNSSNESRVSEIVTTIPHYSFYFAPIIKTESIKVGKLNKTLVKDCKMLAKNVGEQFVLMTIPYVNQENYFESLTNRVENDTRRILVQYIDSYTFLLKSLELLIDKQILHMDIKDDNVVYNRDFKNPIIIDFGISISMKDLQKKHWANVFYVYAPDYYIWSLEIHVICFLLHEKESLTKEDIEDICQTYVKHNPIFKYFSSAFQQQYLEGAIGYYHQFIDMSITDIIKQLLQYWRTWDNYSLTILNLRFFSYLFSNQYIHNNCTQYLSEMLLTNIHFNGNKRLSVIETRYTLKQFFEQDMTLDGYIEMRKQMVINDKTIKKQMKKDVLTRS